MSASAQVVPVSSASALSRSSVAPATNAPRVQRAVRGRLGRVPAAAELGQRGEQIPPELAVPGEPFAGLVLAVLRDQVGDRPEGRLRRLGAANPRGVVGRDPAGEHRRAVAVDDQVVVQLDAPHVLIGQSHQRIGAQGTVHHAAAGLGCARGARRRPARARPRPDCAPRAGPRRGAAPRARRTPSGVDRRECRAGAGAGGRPRMQARKNGRSGEESNRARRIHYVEM